ncbi:hypothetical protein [Streptomyces sp. NPDC007083]|uniref:hypothetical protein n=1 Tax=Streptomyces sp. NPDC007083 TaxID=3156913 RepID=UPI0033E95C42
MALMDQYTLDIWRLGSHGQAPPPAPGSHEAKLLRAWWVARREARQELGSGGAAADRAAAPSAGPRADRDGARQRASRTAPRPLRRRARRA